MHHSELRARRRRLGLTQAQLAEALEVPANTLARWERGELPIRHSGLLRLALQALDDALCAASSAERLARDWPSKEDDS